MPKFRLNKSLRFPCGKGYNELLRKTRKTDVEDFEVKTETESGLSEIDYMSTGRGRKGGRDAGSLSKVECTEENAVEQVGKADISEEAENGPIHMGDGFIGRRHRSVGRGRMSVKRQGLVEREDRPGGRGDNSIRKGYGSEGRGRGLIGRGNGFIERGDQSSVNEVGLRGRGNDSKLRRGGSFGRGGQVRIGDGLPRDEDGFTGKRSSNKWFILNEQKDSVGGLVNSKANEEHIEQELLENGSVDEDFNLLTDERKKKKRKQKKKKNSSALKKHDEDDEKDDIDYSSRIVYFDSSRDEHNFERENPNDGQFFDDYPSYVAPYGQDRHELVKKDQRGMKYGRREFRRSRPDRTVPLHEGFCSPRDISASQVQRSVSSVSDSSSVSGIIHGDNFERMTPQLTGLTITTCRDGRRHVQTTDGLSDEDKTGKRKRKNKKKGILNQKVVSNEDTEKFSNKQQTHEMFMADMMNQDASVIEGLVQSHQIDRQVIARGRNHRWSEDRQIAAGDRCGEYSFLLGKIGRQLRHPYSEVKNNPDDFDAGPKRKNKRKHQKQSLHQFEYPANDRVEMANPPCHQDENDLTHLPDFLTGGLEGRGQGSGQVELSNLRPVKHHSGSGGRGSRGEGGADRIDPGAAGDGHRGRRGHQGGRGGAQHHGHKEESGISHQQACALNECHNTKRGQSGSRGGCGSQTGKPYSPKSRVDQQQNGSRFSLEHHTGDKQQVRGRRGLHNAGDGQHRRNRDRKHHNKKQNEKFENYWSQEDVAVGVERGVIVEGPIRINPKRYIEAYVPLPDGSADVYIPNLLYRNRALNGDVVAIKLLDKDDWRVYTEELEQYESRIRPVASDGPDGDDSGPDVVIEEENEVVSTDARIVPNEQDAKVRKQPTPRKCYTTVKEVKFGGSPIAKSLFESGIGEDGDNFKSGEGVPMYGLVQKTGKVVAILERKHSRVASGHIRLMSDRNPNMALFSPTDSRVPRIQIPMSDCPKDFFERPDDHSQTLFIARIIDWEDTSLFAKGQLARSLGEAGQIEPETEAILIEHNVDYEEFSQEVLSCLPEDLPWTIPASEFDYRRDLRSQCIFTIDPSTARDLDDALSIEALENGNYEVGVHIADVSFFLDESTPLDMKAAGRATSVYLVQRVIPMLPRLLCEELCSLNPDSDRLAFSVIWIMDGNGNVESEWFGRSIIRSCVKLSYDHAQGFISDPKRDWKLEELPPITNNFNVDDIKTRVLQLDKIAKCLRKRRFDDGALRLDQVKLSFTLNQETGMPNGYLVYEQKDSNRLIEEFMLLANMSVAHRIYKQFPQKALLRRHPPPQNKMVDDLKDMCEQLGVALDLSNSQTWQESLNHFQGTDEFSAARMQVLVALSSKPMQNAKYFCSGMIEDTEVYRHYALNVPLYTHFTSPIRRYADVIVHRLLAASLDYSELTSKDCSSLQKQADICNDKKYLSKRVQEMSLELFFAAFVKEAGPFEEKAMVMGVMDHSFDVFILKFAVVKRIYCDQLDLQSKIYTKNNKKPQLTLVWKGDENEPEVRQTITIFTSVVIYMKEDKDPLKWKAILKCPL